MHRHPNPGDEVFDVFISYTHADIAAAEQLQNLLEGIERAPMRVWRDVMRLKGGEPLNATVSQALRAARVVVGLWSPNVEKNPDWVSSETSYALHAGKYVALSLPGFDVARLPAPHQPYYCAPFNNCMANPDRLLMRIAEVREAQLGAPIRKLPAPMLPYTVDCSPQVHTLKGWLRNYCEKLACNEPAKRPLFVLSATPDDDPELLVARIVRHEMSSLQLAGDRSLVPEQEPLSIPWPEPGTYRASALVCAIRSAAGAGGDRRGERLAIRHCLIVDPDAADVQLADDWVEQWDNLDDDVVSGAIPLLVVVTTPARWWQIKSKRLSHASDIVAKVGGAQGRRTVGVVLPPLQPISRADALLWDIHSDLPPGTRRQLGDFIEANFAGRWRHSAPRLGPFAQAISGADWWQDFTRNHG